MLLAWIHPFYYAVFQYMNLKMLVGSFFFPWTLRGYSHSGFCLRGEEVVGIHFLKMTKFMKSLNFANSSANAPLSLRIKPWKPESWDNRCAQNFLNFVNPRKVVNFRNRSVGKAYILPSLGMSIYLGWVLIQLFLSI